ncbi:MAG: DUF4369 domain-containing protein [Bacteroidaceae bacterium]|nr:DUF4369 domain-containing protein [Bacteroidaceae bacterium]
MFNWIKEFTRQGYLGALYPLLLLTGGVFLIVSCAEQYNISGNSSVSTLDGRMLYLKAPDSKAAMCSLDSCEVIHGKFNFMGMVDSTVFGEIFMDNEGFMPIVIEKGDISIFISNTEQRIVGSQLNDRLYRFLEQKNRIEEDIMNLSNQEAQWILSGVHPMIAHRRVAEKTNRMYNQLEELETDFIATNCNNILGHTFFNMLCSKYPYPILTSQINKIIKRSSAGFRKDPTVRTYIQAAEANMKLIENSNR